MASPVFNALTSAADGSVVTFTWTLTSADATGDGFCYAEYADVTFVVRGTWGTATGFKLQGSADNTNWITTPGLSSAAGGAEISLAADKNVTIIERPLYIRPIITTAGSGATLTVTAVCRRATPLRT